ncbi:hypothetical protein CPB85DRAFT_1254269 [Mucidula mucida]|nr:hypothetical protein CPB85DRAFT_1254269 [Mucidula mucida]
MEYTLGNYGHDANKGDRYKSFSPGTASSLVKHCKRLDTMNQWHLRQSYTGHTVQIPTSTFIERHATLPRLTDKESHELITSVTRRLWGKHLDDNGWRKTKIVDNKTEDAIFANLAPIADAIWMACCTWDKKKHKLGEATCRMECNPRQRTHSGVVGMAGAHFILTNSTTLEPRPPSHRTDIADKAGGGECKKDISERAQNENQLVGGVARILHNDPARRFVIAFTIEGVEMRFWYFSRSHIAVSEAFDYHTNPEDFIRFIIFMTFADVIDLGYDPTLIRIRDEDDKIQYVFNVGGKSYRTIRSLDDSSARDVVTRATRVWAARECDPITKQFLSEHEVALKDFWPYTGAQGEKAIQDEIYSALRVLDKKIQAGVPLEEIGLNIHPDDSMTIEEYAKPFFMEILADEVVHFTREGVVYDDSAPAPDPYDEEFSYAAFPKQASALQGTVPGTTRSRHVRGKTPPKDAVPDRIHAHQGRTHRRIVFKDCCMTLYDVANNCIVYTEAMLDLLEGLNCLRLAGFVHRDISPGNCLVLNTSGGIQVKISDLEYARRYDVDSSQLAPLTGTPGFMAVEYQKRRHRFLPDDNGPKTPPPQFQALSFRNLKARALPDTPLLPDELDTRAPKWFRFNFLHDVESVLWLYCWLLFNTIPKSIEGSVSTEDLNRLVDYKELLFRPSLVPTNERFSFVAQQAEYRTARGVLDPIYTQVPYGASLIKGLKVFEDLVGFYSTVEASEPIATTASFMWGRKEFLPDFYLQLQIRFMKVLQGLRASKEDMTTVTLQPPSGVKRPAEEPPAFVEGDCRSAKRPRTEASIKAKASRSKDPLACVKGRKPARQGKKKL